jgi:hypothetical protein
VNITLYSDGGGVIKKKRERKSARFNSLSLSLSLFFARLKNDGNNTIIIIIIVIIIVVVVVGAFNTTAR